MYLYSLGELSDAVGGTLVQGARPDLLVTGPLVFDSWAVTSGSLFACLPGRTADGHDFAAQATAAGAAAVLTTRPVGVPAIVVENVLTAMGKIAGLVASSYRGTTIGITGSAGKTSSKDLLKSILALSGPTVATHRSFNNEIGFPVTVSQVTHGTQNLVLEMGARGIGHIQALCHIARPDVSVVLGVGSAHIGEFGSRETIARAKTEVFRRPPGLPARGPL